MIYTLHPRDVVIENVDKMIHCGDASYGGAMYRCPDCGEWKYVAFRCHSRFCPTCGNMYAIDRTTSMSFKLINCTHRHCVFTIPEQLRPYFLKDCKLLSCLFSAVRSVVLRMFHKMNKSKNFTPGVICVLYTFGRSLQWNPHIHYEKSAIMERNWRFLWNYISSFEFIKSTPFHFHTRFGIYLSYF